MVQSSSFLPLGHDTINEQDVIAMKSPVRSVGRKATITREELFQATLNLIGPQKSIASLSLREVAREAGIAPNSFYRHFKDIDELAIALIDRAGLVLRKIIREARLQASMQQSIIRSSVEVFIQQLDADENLTERTDVVLQISLNLPTVLLCLVVMKFLGCQKKYFPPPHTHWRGWQKEWLP